MTKIQPKAKTFILQISLSFSMYLFHVPGLCGQLCETSGCSSAKKQKQKKNKEKQKKSELYRKEQNAVPWYSPFHFHWTEYKRSDQYSAQLGVRFINSRNKWDPHRDVIYFSVWRCYRGQAHKGCAVVNTFQGSLNTLHQPLFYLFNYVHDMGKTHV